MITRRAFLGTGIAAAAPSSNLLVFMSDQESALLPGPARLPNRQRLLSAGTEFTHAFCNTPQCSPARSSLLTGRQPHRTGVLTNVDGGSLGKPLPLEMANIGSLCEKHGYATGYFGKWHLGNQDDGLAKYGFGYSLTSGSDEEIARQAAEWVRKQKGKYLCWVSILNPHHIYDISREIGSVKPRDGVRPPHSGLENLAGKPAEQRAFVDEDQGRQTREFTPTDWIKYRSYYLELLEKADACLGTVLDALDAASTTVAYTSDHGDALGEHGLPYKGPFMYEELVRIPFILAGGRFGGRKRQDLVTQCDLAPTLASVAGIPWPEGTDGRSLLRDTKGPDAVFLEYYAKQKWVNPIRTIRTRTHKLNLYDSGHRELYVLASDPHELRNMAGKLPIESRLAERLGDRHRP